MDPLFWLNHLDTVIAYILIAGACYSTLVIIAWCAHGRPQFRSWSHRFWLTKPFARRFLSPPRPQIWGVSGPLSDKEQTSRQGTSGRRPKSLRTPVDFFRSGSPLDDLLFTFRITRWMVRPLVGAGDEDEGLPLIRDDSVGRRTWYGNGGYEKG